MKPMNQIKVYGLEESVRASKYPMSTDIDAIIPSDEIGFWLENDFLPRFIKHMESREYPQYEICDDYVSMKLKKDDNTIVSIKIDEEDIPSVFDYDWHFTRYCVSNKVGTMHRYIMRDRIGENEELVIDHINRDTTDNRKSNLRLATRAQNGYNSTVRKNNISGVMGVCWKSDKGKWKAFINSKNKQIHLGYYDCFEDAVRARLKAESEMCGEFAPQWNLFDAYNIKKSTNTTIKKTYSRLSDAITTYKVAAGLGKQKAGSGEDNYLNGIICQFDLTFTVKAWTEAERYHFLDFVSSQSTMHRITRFDLDKAYIEYVDPRVIDIMREKIAVYNRMKEDGAPADELADLYLGILYTNPAGFRLTARMTTNYRQLKTIYYQRKAHRLPEWREMCRQIRKLPHFEELCLKGGT